jgi:hypothetical protein
VRSCSLAQNIDSGGGRAKSVPGKPLTTASVQLLAANPFFLLELAQTSPYVKQKDFRTIT